MPEVKSEVRPVGVRYMCDECEGGEMIPTGRVIQLISTVPPKFEHMCKLCGAKENLAEQFPAIRFESMEEDPTIVGGVSR